MWEGSIGMKKIEVNKEDRMYVSGTPEKSSIETKNSRRDELEEEHLIATSQELQEILCH